MLVKLEEDAEVAYNEYDKAVKAEDRAALYVTKVLWSSFSIQLHLKKLFRGKL